MEYLAKIRLDDAAERVRRLDNRIAAETNKDERDKLVEERNRYVKLMYDVGAEIGLNIEKYYGIKPVAGGTPTTGDDDWFHNWNKSPSGFGDS